MELATAVARDLELAVRGAVLRAGDDDLRWIAVRLAQLGAPVEVIDPPELLDVIRGIGDWASAVGRSEDQQGER